MHHRRVDALGPDADLHEFYFNLEDGAPDLQIGSHDDVTTAYVLTESPFITWSKPRRSLTKSRPEPSFACFSRLMRASGIEPELGGIWMKSLISTVRPDGVIGSGMGSEI